MSDQALIPAKHADIFWNDEADAEAMGRPAGAEVLVLDRRETAEKGIGHGDPDHLMCSTGAMGDGWLTSGHPLDNPAGVLARNWLRPGSRPESVHAALREFAKIEECQWAREMLAAFDWDPDGPDEG